MITTLLTAAPPSPYLWTSDEFQRMGELGFFTDKRVELIEGQVLQMSPMGNPHSIGVMLLTHELPKIVGADCSVLIQGPLLLNDNSQPMPDGTILRGTPREFQGAKPQDVVVVIEIADSSIRFDRTTKARLYAAAQIPEYWIINVTDKQIEVMRDPTSDAGYATKSIAKTGDQLKLVAAPEILIEAGKLIP